MNGLIAFMLAASGSVGPSVNLSGTLGVPVSDDDLATFPDDATAGWSFRATGDLLRFSGTAYSSDQWFGIPGDNVHSTPDGTYYIRVTLQSGTSPSGDSVGAWLSLAVNREWYWVETGLGTVSGVLLVEIATDSGGTDIVASGYYDGEAVVEP